MNAVIKRLLPSLCLLMAGLWAQAQDIENVHVETYYITDASDATDTIGISGGLPAGTRTYRVFVDLCADCSLRGIYGAECHPLVIESSAPIFNHADRGRAYGHAINNSWVDEGTVALDSWVTLGAATNQRFGIRKELDDDGSIIGGANSDGGSAEMPGGLLINSESGLGIPLTTSDGLVPLNGSSALPPSFNPTGEDIGTVLGEETVASTFVSDSCRIGCATPGTYGPTVANEILVAQITTAGDLRFELNIEVEHADGSVLRYVARDTCLADDETPSGLLTYPPACGCTDPDFLEYDPTAGCDDGSCATTIIFGCLDPEACNYDPSANFDVPQLCCYGIDDCNGLDPALICADVGIEAIGAELARIAPNPVSASLNLHVVSGWAPLTIEITDGAGRTAMRIATPRADAQGMIAIDVSGLPAGTYVLRASDQQRIITNLFLKL